MNVYLNTSLVSRSPALQGANTLLGPKPLLGKAQTGIYSYIGKGIYWDHSRHPAQSGSVTANQNMLVHATVQNATSLTAQ